MVGPWHRRAGHHRKLDRRGHHRPGAVAHRHEHQAAAAAAQPAHHMPDVRHLLPGGEHRHAVPGRLAEQRHVQRGVLHLQLRQRVLDGLQVGEDQLGVDGVDVVGRVDLAVDVDDVVVFEGAYDLADRVGLANVGEELVA